MTQVTQGRQGRRKAREARRSGQGAARRALPKPWGQGRRSQGRRPRRHTPASVVRAPSSRGREGRPRRGGPGRPRPLRGEDPGGGHRNPLGSNPVAPFFLRNGVPLTVTARLLRCWTGRGDGPSRWRLRPGAALRTHHHPPHPAGRFPGRDRAPLSSRVRWDSAGAGRLGRSRRRTLCAGVPAPPLPPDRPDTPSSHASDPSGRPASRACYSHCNCGNGLHCGSRAGRASALWAPAAPTGSRVAPQPGAHGPAVPRAESCGGGEAAGRAPPARRAPFLPCGPPP